MTQDPPEVTGLTDPECQTRLVIMLAGVVATLLLKLHHSKTSGGELAEDFIQYAAPYVRQLDPDTFTDKTEEELADMRKKLLAMILGDLEPSDESRKFPN